MVAERDTEDIDVEEKEAKESEEKSEPGPALRLPKEYMVYVDRELGMVKFLDYLAEESFDLIHQDKMINTYKKQLIADFFGVSDDLVGEPEDFYNKSALYSEFKRLEIEESIDSVKKKTEDIAEENGVKKPFHKRLQMTSLIISASVIAVMIGINFIPSVAQYSTYVLIGAMLVMCVVPQLLRKNMTKKWNDFKYLHRKEVEEAASDEINKIREFNQQLIDDCREFCLENKIPLQLINFSLFSDQYENLELKKEAIRNDQIQYQYQIAYPEGVEPFDIPGSIAQVDSPGLVGKSTGTEMNVPDDDENDLFVVLKQVAYSDDGKMQFSGLGYLNENQQEEIEDLLRDSDFVKVNDPDNIIEDITGRKDILCGCEKPIKLGELHVIETPLESGFEFYMLLGTKCMECGKNPFVIFPKQGIEIPDSLRDVFNA